MLICHRLCIEIALAGKANQFALRRVGKAAACPPSRSALDDRWWARRQRSFAHPTDSHSQSAHRL